MEPAGFVQDSKFRATVILEVSLVPPLMIAVLHQHRGNVQLLLHAQADPWQAVPIVSLCDHPWYWFGFLSRCESVNVLQVSVAQGPADTVADLLTQPDLTAMTEHATLLLDSIVQKYQLSTGPQHMRGGYASYRWRRILAGLYLPVRIRRELQDFAASDQTGSKKPDAVTYMLPNHDAIFFYVVYVTVYMGLV